MERDDEFAQFTFDEPAPIVTLTGRGLADVILPGRVIEDTDGIPIGMEENRLMTGATIDPQTGVIAGWITRKGTPHE